MKSKKERANKSHVFRLHGDVIGELRAEAKRQDRPMSWLLRRAWLLARGRIQQLPPADGAVAK